MRVFTLFFFFIASFACAQTLPPDFKAVNSKDDEQNPILSPDGKSLYFTIGNHPLNAGGKRDPGDIWFSLMVGVQWTAPINLGNVLNDVAYNSVAGFSADGNTMFLLSHYNHKEGRARTQGISFSRKISSGWSSPENINIPYFMNRSPVLTGYLTPDQSTFIFAAESYVTEGAEDLYVSFRNADNTWTEPRHLGKNVNTEFQELSPSLSADKTILYFSSNGRKGYGSYDVYFSKRLDDSWTNWSQPVSMGASVNSEGRELFYRTYPTLGMALYTSTSNSDGYGDIKMVQIPKEQDSLINKVLLNAPDTIVKLTEIKRDKPLTADDKQVRVFGKVVSTKTNLPIPANIHFQSDTLRTYMAGKDGKYSLSVPTVNEYVIRVEANGFVGTIERLDIRTFEMKELEMNFKLQPIEIGATVNLKNVLFKQSTSTLLPESADELNMVADFMKANPRVSIALAGHTDNRGIPEHNVKLSKNRVDKVKEYLVSRGVEAKRISGKGYGGAKPIASNDTEETRRLNRRVEFTIVKD